MSSSVLKTHVHPHTHDFLKNSRRMVDLLPEIKNQEEQIRQGGGAKATESQHKKGRLTARERIAKLVDPGTPFLSWGPTPPTRCTRSGAGRPRPAPSPASRASRDASS